ncbi:MAG TPA: acetate--CoA ligase family protein, partial [Thermomicrobiales bacterium]|nr:acetate--CoA ligase family protein [Thermomicrobiales bacterium]
VYQVNPNYAEIAGRPAWPSLASLPEPPDAVAIAVPARATPQVVREAIAAGAGGAVAYAAGFAELGPDGLALQDDVAALARESGIPIIGPNCLGIVNYTGRAPLWGITTGTRLEPGAVAVVGQSGNIVLSLMSSSSCPPLAHAVSCGNQAVVDAIEVIDFFLDEPEVRTVIAVLESIGDIAAFRRVAARAAEREAPIIALKLGRSEQGSRAAIAHTGSLTGAAHLVDALFRECGVIRVDDLDEAGATAALLAGKRRPAGRGLGVTASSGGECGLVSDLAIEVGLSLPELPAAQREVVAPLLPPFARPSNPLDITAVGWGHREVSRETVLALAATPGVDLVASVGQASAYVGPLADYGWFPMVDGLGDAAAVAPVPVVVVSTVADVQQELIDALAAHGIPVLAGTRTAMRAMANAGRYAEWLRERPVPVMPPPVNEARRTKALALLPPPGSGGVSETISKAVARLYGIPVPDGEMATTEDGAVRVAGEVGYPVVLKIEADGLRHKTEAGGVAVGIDDDNALRVAYAELVARVVAAAPDVSIRGVRVERMVRGGVELVVGGTNDPIFGPVVVAGMGGVLVELLRDTVHRLVP